MARNDRSERVGNLLFGVVGFAIVTCAALAVAGALGVTLAVGAVMAALTSWWMLIPTVLVAGGIVGWSAWKLSRPMSAAPDHDEPTTVSQEAR